MSYCGNHLPVDHCVQLVGVNSQEKYWVVSIMQSCASSVFPRHFYFPPSRHILYAGACSECGSLGDLQSGRENESVRFCICISLFFFSDSNRYYYFIFAFLVQIRNSWSTQWGVDGYMYLDIGHDTCRISSIVTYTNVSLVE